MSFTKTLSAAMEYPSDTILVAAAQMAAAIEPIVLGPLSRDIVTDSSVTLEYTEPLHMAVQQARKALDAVAESYDESVRNQGMLSLLEDEQEEK
jgi:hypothetical protein